MNANAIAVQEQPAAYVRGQIYERGEVVRHGRATWIAIARTVCYPGEDALSWRIVEPARTP